MFHKHNRTKLFDSKPSACFFTQIAFGTAFTVLTSGTFLNGLAILMGANDVISSYISVIANICGVLILFLSTFLQRFQSKKKLTIGLTVLTKLATLFIVAIPILFPSAFQLAVFIPTVVIAFTLQAQTTVSLNLWMIDFIDDKKRGRYISARQTLLSIVTVVLSITGGYFLDTMQKRYIGFLLIFIAAAIMGIVEIVILMRTPDSPTPSSSGEKSRLRDMVKLPVKNRPYLGFVIYIVVFYLLLNISDSFTMVYMMRYLALPYTTINALYMIISLPQIFLLGIWGKISDRCGHNFVLKASIWIFAGETLFMVFAAQNNYFIFIPLAFIMASIANSGFIIAVFNRRYELIPKQNRIVYDNFYSAAIGLGFILGPMIGGGIKSLLESSPVITNIMPFASIRILYIFSTIGILLLQIIYSLTQRKNSCPTDVPCTSEEPCCTEC